MLRSRRNSIVVRTLGDVDFSEMKLPGIVVYDHPKDFPYFYVGRVWEMAVNRPTNVAVCITNLEQLRNDIIQSGFSVCFGRDKKDDPRIVETWV